MNKNLNDFEKVLLLGLLPLLGGTKNLKQALLVGLSTIVIAVVIYIVNNIFSAGYEQKWYWLIGIGIGISYSLFLFLPQLLPQMENIINHSIVFIGVTPLIYIGAGDKNINFTKLMSWFLFFMVLAGAMREILGQGTLINYSLTPAGSPPMGIMSKFPGSFIIISVIWVLFGLLLKSKNIKKEEGSESLV
ncbi:MAG: hypothetical protein ACOCQ2_00425 [Halanaerobiales bacterium]